MDENVVRTHMTQLANAGVDFIVIDNTNVLTSWKSEIIGNSGMTGWDLYGVKPTFFCLIPALKCVPRV